MGECGGKETPLTKNGGEQLVGEPLVGREQASNVRRSIVIMNYMVQDRSDLAATARELSQRMATPTEGTEMCLKRATRYLSSHRGGVGGLEGRSTSHCAFGPAAVGLRITVAGVM